VSEKGEAVATVQKVLKGELADKEVTVDLLAGAFQAQGQAVMERIAQGARQALLFVGFFREEGLSGQGGESEAKGLLHLGGQWAVLSKWQDQWDMDKLDPRLLGTWAGSTDMLLRAVQYVQSDPDADVPVTAGVEWAEEGLVGKVEGKVAAAIPVDLDGTGKPTLYVADEGGDRLFHLQGSNWEDVTAPHKLTSRSVAACWGDFDGNGKLDLASWDGNELSIHAQGPDGSFTAAARIVAESLKDGCLALTTVDCGRAGRPALLASTQASPVLLLPQADGSFQGQPLVSGEFPGKDFGPAGQCLVADLDGDAVPDILQLFAQGALFYRGKAPGTFEAPVRTQAAAGKGRNGACLGDYDADGLLDVFVTAEDGNRLWHNLGGGEFLETLDASGEISYIAKPGGIGAQTGDFNNDGRQDILIEYGVGICPQLFFNRGFRSFGHARSVDLAELKRVPQAGEGQQAGCLADFNGDGALDMALVLANGEIWVFPRLVGDGGALGLTAALSVRSPYAGPLNVCAWRYERRMAGPNRRSGRLHRRSGGRPCDPEVALPGGPAAGEGHRPGAWGRPRAA
jgi:hypothetical protein